MTRRVPVVATIVVAAAVAAMIWLGIWQLYRRDWKEGLLARYRAAATLPPAGFPRVPTDQALLFRRSSAYCLRPVDWRASAGRDRRGRPGYRHVVDCATGAEGPGAAFDMGWSERPDAPRWSGGQVAGVIGPDSGGRVLLVADTPAPGLAASAAPDVTDIPNNHLAYAVQWFLFAGVAAAIYGIVLWRRIPPRDGEGDHAKHGGGEGPRA